MANNSRTYSQEEIESLIQKWEKVGDKGLTSAEKLLLKDVVANSPDIAAYIRQVHANRKGGYGNARSGNKLSQMGTYLDRMNGGYGSSKVSSPGGFKKSGRDPASYERMEGELTPETLLDEVKANDRGGYSFNGRDYSARQVEAIKKRGMSGATLSQSDQAIYDKIMQEKKEQRAAVLRARQADEVAKQQQAKFDFEQRGKDADDARKLAFWKAQQDYLEKREISREERKRQAEQQKYDEFLDRHPEIPEGTRLSKKDMEDIDAGRKKWDHSAKDKEWLQSLNDELARIAEDPSISWEDKEEMYEQIREMEEGRGKGVQDVPGAPQGEPILSADKKFMWKNSANDWVPYEDKEAAAKEKADAAAEKVARSASEKKRAYISKRIGEKKKEYENSEDYDESNPFDFNSAAVDAALEYDAINQVMNGETPITPSKFNARKYDEAIGPRRDGINPSQPGTPVFDPQEAAATPTPTPTPPEASASASTATPAEQPKVSASDWRAKREAQKTADRESASEFSEGQCPVCGAPIVDGECIECGYVLGDPLPEGELYAETAEDYDDPTLR